MAHLDSPLVCERLLLPCLRLIARLTLPTAPPMPPPPALPPLGRPDLAPPRPRPLVHHRTSRAIRSGSESAPRLASWLNGRLSGRRDLAPFMPPASSAPGGSGVRSRSRRSRGLAHRSSPGASKLLSGVRSGRVPATASVGRAAQAPTQPSESGGSGPSAARTPRVQVLARPRPLRRLSVAASVRLAESGSTGAHSTMARARGRRVQRVGAASFGRTRSTRPRRYGGTGEAPPPLRMLPAPPRCRRLHRRPGFRRDGH